jgi:thiamine-phosphate pyrophosphorylase
MNAGRGPRAPRLWLVTDPSFGDDAIVRCVERVSGELDRGAFGVQLRDKTRAIPSLRLFASRLRFVTREAGAFFVVNGHNADAVRVARDVGADGVHLGGGAGTVARARAVMGPRAWVSVAAHDDDDVRRAGRERADAVLVSPIFATAPAAHTTLASGECTARKVPRGVEALRSARACAPTQLRVIALGGITADTVTSCTSAGADGVAVIRALLASDRPDEVARAVDDGLRRRWYSHAPCPATTNR